MQSIDRFSQPHQEGLLSLETKLRAAYAKNLTVGANKGNADCKRSSINSHTRPRNLPTGLDGGAPA